MVLRAGQAPRRKAAFSFLLLAAAAVLVAVPTAEAAPTRSLAITWSSAGAPAAWKTFDGNPPKTFDIDGDGREEILAQNDNHNLYVFDSTTGKLLATLKSTYPSGWGARTFNGPEAYREANVTHVVQMNSAAYLTSWRFDPAASNATKFVFVKEWERRQKDCYSGAGSDSKPVLADLDRDGKMDIVVTTEESGVYAIRGNGSLYWKKCISGGNGEARPVDLNLDGFLDVVFASDGGVVTAMQGRPSAGCSASPPCPNTMWTFNIRNNYNLSSASVPVGAGFGQLDGLAGPDIVVGARDSHDPDNWDNDHALLLALSSTGKVLWARQDANDGNPLTYTHPIVADAAGDGTNEVYWGDWNTIGHKPPFDEAQSWKVTGPAHYYRYDNAGNLVWRHTMATFWSNKDLALADADGDGRQEILAAGPNAQGHEGIWAIDSETGSPETFIDAYPWQVTRGPIVADLRGDGRMQLILETGPMATTAGPAVQVFEMGVPYDAVWPHLPDPPQQSVILPPPPPSGEFGASFTIRNPNAWWQEVSVSPDSPRAIDKVEVRVNNGDWEPMTKSSWGPWTSSKATPAGAKVEFRAWDTGNNVVSQSAAFTWLDGTLTKRSVPCGCSGGTTSSTSSTSTTSSSPSTTSSSPTSISTGPSAFQATFTPKAVGNDWWVEVAVAANEPVAKVEASRNGGAYVELTKQSWGTWAKSINAPNGTSIVFRATSAGGGTATSQAVIWT
ncbi:MAG TPA: VCBS repeat-containing protein [Candidatus Thermoplasmatota archaeon]|nr:VCBS repeat-containing protein [Candidatus Thermoplasmatota archaeon]